MTIKLDKSDISILVTCSKCKAWYAFALDTYEAWLQAAKHEAAAHPGNTQAINALAMTRYRQREKSKKL